VVGRAQRSDPPAVGAPARAHRGSGGGGREEGGHEPLKELQGGQDDLGAVVALDVHRGVDAEPGGRDPLEDPMWFPPALRSSPAGSLPGEHTNGVVFLEQALGMEVAQNAALDEALEGEPVVGGETGGLVEAYGSVGSLPEDAVEDGPGDLRIVVEVGTQAGAWSGRTAPTVRRDKPAWSSGWKSRTPKR